VTVPADRAVQRAGLDAAALMVAGVSLRRMPRVMQVVIGRRVRAITLNRRIFISASRFDAVVAGQDPVLLVHELIHVGQWADYGAFFFILRYVSEYLRLRMLGVSHDAAYRGISFEHAAYDASKGVEGRAA
jgi:hypothetical protein